MPDFGWKVCCIAWLNHAHFEPLGIRRGADGFQYLFDDAVDPGKGILDRYMLHGQCPLGEASVAEIALANCTERDAFDEVDMEGWKMMMRMDAYITQRQAPLSRLRAGLARATGGAICGTA
jgi:hypothetical protein